MRKRTLLFYLTCLFAFSLFSCATLRELQTGEVEAWQANGVNAITHALYDEDGFDYFGFNADKIHYKTKAKTDELGNSREFYQSDYSKHKPYKMYYKKRTYAPKIASTPEPPTSSRVIHTGPRGGKYYINSKGKKVYQRKKK